MVKRGTENATVLERVIERVFVRVMERVLERAMSRWIGQMKERENNRLMKRIRLIGRTQGAPMMKQVMKRGKKQTMKRGKKRAKEPATEPEMEQAMEEIIERTREPMMQQVIETAGQNVSPRTPLDHDQTISEAFAVMDYCTRDYHVKRSKKVEFPSLKNDLSPLKKIKKNAECHTDNNIHTVRDFKQMHRTDLNKQIEEDYEKLNAVQVVHQGLAGMQNDCNLASSSQYMSALLQENVPNLTSHLPVISTQSLNNDFGDPTSLFNLMTECSPNNNGLLEQKMALHNIVMSKILTKSDITSKIDLPTEMVEHMFPVMNGRSFLDLKADDEWGKEWPFRYHTRPNGSKICPVFTIGWQRFVEAKCVRVGDELIFSGHQVAGVDGQLKMKYMIQVIRPGPFTFKGEPVTLDVEYLA